jgi:hypothetical protein
MHALSSGTLGVAIAGLAFVAPGVSGAAAALGPVSVQVPPTPSVKQRVTIAFHPRGQLAHGGYYYAVVVLRHYLPPSYPLRCAVSSDMGVTGYGFPRRGRAVRLTLLAAASAEDQWCPGAMYEGAVYAVPHKPSCSSLYPCYGKGSCGPQAGVCGVVVSPGYYSYPGGLPKPIDRSTRIVGHFTLHFPEAPPTASGTRKRVPPYTIPA